MKTYEDFENSRLNSMQIKSTIFNSTKIDGLFLLSEIIIKVGKYFPIIILSFASLNLLLAVNDLFTNNIGFAILNTLFALGNFHFLIQLHQKTKAHQYEYGSYLNRADYRSVEGSKE